MTGGGAGPLPFATALEAAAAVRARRLSARELMQLVLERVQRLNPALNALVNVCAEEALAEAGAADRALAAGVEPGPLHGVPVTVKESIDVKGLPATGGFPGLKGRHPLVDAACVARLRAAGAIVIGNTNVPALLADWQTDNPIYGRTSSPWDPGRTPGGSSGGSAAALAAGLGFLSLGSDLAGSIRIPAHFSGVYGHKPTLDLVPERGHVPLPPFREPQPPTGLAVLGPMARSAGDLAAALRTVAGPLNPGHRWTEPAPRRSRLAGYRLGYVLDHPRCPLSSDVRAVLEAALDALRRAGVSLVEGFPAGVDAEADFRTYVYLLHAAIGVASSEAEMEALRERARRGDDSIAAIRARAITSPHGAQLDAQSRRLRAQSVWAEFFKEHDAFLMPAAFTAAFAHDAGRWSQRRLPTPEGDRPYDDVLFWSVFASLTGLPATVAPVGLTAAGLPVGVQIMGPYLEDATPIDVAARMAEVTGGFRSPPGYE